MAAKLSDEREAAINSVSRFLVTLRAVRPPRDSVDDTKPEALPTKGSFVEVESGGGVGKVVQRGNKITAPVGSDYSFVRVGQGGYIAELNQEWNILEIEEKDEIQSLVPVLLACLREGPAQDEEARGILEKLNDWLPVIRSILAPVFELLKVHSL